MKISTKFYRKNLPLRLSLRVVVAVNLLLMATLFAMFFYSKRVMKEDALNRASQTLEDAMVKVDNILLNVEETMGNMYFNLKPLYKNPDTMHTYCHNIVSNNPYITGCTFAFKPGVIVGHKELIANSTQEWFNHVLEAKNPLWLNPLDSMSSDEDPLISFCLPIWNGEGEIVGVIRSDVSLRLFSDVVANSKPSPNSYCALLDRKGSFIVHPTGKDLRRPSDFGLPEETLHNVLSDVMSGETGYRPISVSNRDLYVFYKPFERAYMPHRSMEKLGWTIAVAMPKDDIYGEYNMLFNYAVIIAIGGMLMLFLSCWAILFVRLRPLKMLKNRAERIALGHYNEPIPHTWSRDEIGSLQRNFIRMRRALVSHISELEQLNKTIQQRSKELKTAYKQAKKADAMKTAFLHHMSNQIVTPAQAIDKDVTELSAICNNHEKPNTAQLIEDIQQNGNAIIQLLNQILNQSEEDMRKEVEHD